MGSAIQPLVVYSHASPGFGPGDTGLLWGPPAAEIARASLVYRLSAGGQSLEVSGVCF